MTLQKGIVTKSTGSYYRVQMEHDGRTLVCRVVGKFRMFDKELSNPIAVGDEVGVELEGEGGLIKKIFPRRNYVVRQSPRRKHELHMLAANIDQAVLIVTIVDPDIKLGFVDRFLLMTETCNIPAVIVFNKADLYDAGALELYRFVKEMYEKMGYQTLLCSVVDGTGMDALVALLKDKTTLFTGQSGVGKSSLANKIQPNLDLRTGEISDYSGKGQHTTTFAEMHNLTFGGQLIDAPGIKLLGFNYLSPEQIAHNFREIFEMSSECRFGGACKHKHEPNCAVKAAVEAESISESRYSSYLQILGETEEQNYWERK